MPLGQADSCFTPCMHRACCLTVRVGVQRCVSHNSQLAFHGKRGLRIHPQSHKAERCLQHGLPSHAEVSQQHFQGVACASSNVDMDSDVSSLIKQLHDHPTQAVFYATGGGMQVSFVWLKLNRHYPLNALTAAKFSFRPSPGFSQCQAHPELFWNPASRTHSQPCRRH